MSSESFSLVPQILLSHDGNGKSLLIIPNCELFQKSVTCQVDLLVIAIFHKVFIRAIEDDDIEVTNDNVTALARLSSILSRIIELKQTQVLVCFPLFVLKLFSSSSSEPVFQSNQTLSLSGIPQQRI
jgi:hypothetical protein